MNTYELLKLFLIEDCGFLEENIAGDNSNLTGKTSSAIVAYLEPSGGRWRSTRPQLHFVVKNKRFDCVLLGNRKFKVVFRATDLDSPDSLDFVKERILKAVHHHKCSLPST